MKNKQEPVKASSLLGGSPYMEMEEAIETYKVHEAAYKDLERRGIFLRERLTIDTDSRFMKDGSPYVPCNLQQLTNKELGDLYNIAHNYYEFVSDQYGILTAQLLEAEQIFKYVSARVHLSKDGTVKDKESKQLVDARYVRANAELLRLKCMRDMLNAVLTRADTLLKTVSRNVTIALESGKFGDRGAFIENHKIKEKHDRFFVRQKESADKKLTESTRRKVPWRKAPAE